MKKYLLVTLMCLFGLSSIAQEKVYLDSKNVEVSEDDACKYWEIKDFSKDTIHFLEYAMDGALMLQGNCLKSDYNHYSGKFTTYHSNGRKFEELRYKEGELVEILCVYSKEGDSFGTEYPFAFVEEKPEYKGGDPALLKFLAENTNYPEIAKQEEISGRVFVQFVITDEGKISKIKVLKGVHELLDTEAERVVALLPDWIPGKQRGINVNVLYIVPINFKLY